MGVTIPIPTATIKDKEGQTSVIQDMVLVLPDGVSNELIRALGFDPADCVRG